MTAAMRGFGGDHAFRAGAMNSQQQLKRAMAEAAEAHCADLPLARK